MTGISVSKGRLFAFGCSFTNYWWATWPQILAKQFGYQLYNYGRPGAGNLFIFNHIIQADQFYRFNSDDIVAVCWTNVCREDRYVNRQWHTGGNIFTNPDITPDWIKQYGDPQGYKIRDFALIHAVHDYLANRNCQRFYFSICDLAGRIDQFAESNQLKPPAVDLYQQTLSEISPSFYDVLWQDDLNKKYQSDINLISKKFVDGHPSPQESLQYLCNVMNIKFTDEVINEVSESQNNWKNILRKFSEECTFKNCRINQMSISQLNEIDSSTRIWPEHHIKCL